MKNQPTITVAALAVCLWAGGARADSIKTEPFEPKPILIKLEDLPAPMTDPGRGADSAPIIAPIPAQPVLYAPPGFSVNLYAGNVPTARYLAYTPAGQLLCAASQANKIYLFGESKNPAVAGERSVFLDEENGAHLPFGIVFDEGHCYVANDNGVFVYSYKPGQMALKGPGKLLMKLGTKGHWTRTLLLSPDGKRLLVSIGSTSNLTPEPPPRATIMSMNLDGSDLKTFATGLRNAVGMGLEPATHELYVCANERDNLGDDLVPDFFGRVREGEFFGWPYAYLSPRNIDPRLTVDGKTTEPDLVAKTVTPDVLIQAHAAPLGLAFYTAEQFPAKYRGGAFVTSHGSWNRHIATGYKIIFVPFKDGRPAGGYEDFVTGFLLDPQVQHPPAWGRPVCVCVAPDGSLLFTDDAYGRIYRVSYKAP